MVTKRKIRGKGFTIAASWQQLSLANDRTWNLGPRTFPPNFCCAPGSSRIPVFVL